MYSPGDRVYLGREDGPQGTVTAAKHLAPGHTEWVYQVQWDDSCPECGGEGTVEIHVDRSDYSVILPASECGACLGLGVLPDPNIWHTEAMLVRIIPD